MNNPDAAGWQRTSPLSAVFFIGKIVEVVAKNALQSFAPLAAYVVAADGPVAGNVLVGIAVFLATIIVIGILRYLFFRFRIEDTSILIRDGVLRKTQLDIKFDRIQAVNIRQNLLYRPFDLVNVILDTAGSSEQEGYLPAVPRPFAAALERQLENQPYPGPQPAGQETEGDPAAEKATLLRYDGADLVRIGLTSNRALLFLAVLAPFIDTLFDSFRDRLIPDDVTGAAGRLIETNAAAVVGAALAFAVMLLFLLAAASVIGAVFRYFRFELAADGARFRSSGGLLTRREHAIRYAKIQALYVRQSPVQRLFRVVQLDARQAASGRESSRNGFTVPLLNSGALSAMAARTFGDELPDVDLRPTGLGFIRVDRHYVLSNVRLRGVLPAVAAMIVLLPSMRALAPLALLWIPAAWLYYLRRYHCLGIRLLENGLCLRGGLLGQRIVAHLYRKVQRVTVSQTPFQRRRRLATLKLYLASGIVRIPYVRQDDAERLRDYVLFRIESDRRAWH